MSIILFLVILAILVFVHELGHFLAAKYFGVRVDEFAIGFPPKIFSFKKGETDYVINLIPFGGYVKIFGENPDEDSISGADSERSLVNKNRGIQATVLLSGIIGNIILAWFLISVGLMSGLPASISEEFSQYTTQKKVLITSVINDSPAKKAGMEAGDKILKISTVKKSFVPQSLTEVQDFINQNGKESLLFSIERNGKVSDIKIIPTQGIITGKYAVGVGMDVVGIVKMPFFTAFWNGVGVTGTIIKSTAQSLWNFVTEAFSGQADFSQISGPVGIVKLVDQASGMGVIYLLSFMSLISINLAIINLVPFPALDGGRVLFVIIEAITRKKMNPIVMNTVNSIGFILLMILMLVVTYKDIVKLF